MVGDDLVGSLTANIDVFIYRWPVLYVSCIFPVVSLVSKAFISAVCAGFLVNTVTFYVSTFFSKHHSTF